jgi:hypothetical protein
MSLNKRINCGHYAAVSISEHFKEIWCDSVETGFICDITGSHGRKDVDVGLLGCDTVWTRKQIPTFRRNILSPSSALKMEKIYLSETSVSTHKSTWRHTEDGDSIFLRNACIYLRVHATSQPRKTISTWMVQ